MNVSSRRLVLSSASPRRRALLETACYEVEVRVPRADESWPVGMNSKDGAIAIAERKLDVLGFTDELALSADTVVVLGNDQLGKPTNEIDAKQMLMRLSGHVHEVVTGFCVSRGARRHREAIVTRVWFRPLSPTEIERYVATGEPFDKAGSYAIQGRAGAFVHRIEGSYTNVVGLPLTEVLAALEALS